MGVVKVVFESVAHSSASVFEGESGGLLVENRQVAAFRNGLFAELGCGGG
ncbi:hypothetical protein [Haloarcula quadrata]|nr:hypothetical protein [Haloarcula quadrata]